MISVTIRKNSLDPSFDEHYNGITAVGPAEFLKSYFEEWPDTAKVYHESISVETEIPLKTRDDVIRFNGMQGHFYVVIYPAGIYLVTALVYAFGIAASFIGSKKKKSTSDQVAQRKEPKAGSPNNGLSERGNTERINQRIPDIFGRVRAFPDLLLKPWSEYKGNQQVEISYFCVGRGEYEIEDIQDGDTPFNQIGRSTSIEVYGPNTSPNSGTPQLTIGSAITYPLVAVRPSSSVSGQTLFAPNADSVYSTHKFKFYRDRIEIDNTELEYGESPGDETKALSFTDVFEAGNEIELDSLTLAGNYNVVSVDSQVLYLDSPETTNGAWAGLSYTTPLGHTGGIFINRIGDATVGPFIVTNVDAVYCNFVGEGGLYKDDGTNQYGVRVLIQIWAQEIDSSDSLIGSPIGTDVFITGSSGSRSRSAVTGKLPLPGWERAKVWCKRITDHDFDFVGTVNDVVQWESLSAVQSITNEHFGNVTTIYAVTYANPASLSIKERKLNCIAKRIIPVRQSGGTYLDGTTSSFADILRFICLDSRIGNRQLTELDITNFYYVQDQIADYFGTDKATEFNYTFDETDFSFEETVRIICEAVFSSAYRQGSLIRLYFEKATASSRLLFNHRNKVPSTEVRSVRFGTNEDKDGVELEWVDPKDGAKIKFYLPEDQSAVNPEQISQLGITNKIQAYFHAHRLFAKIQYQNCFVEFDALQEASMLALNERVLVADNTRPETFDGDVIDQSGTLLTLSQNFEFEDGIDYTVFLQNVDGSVQSVGISPGPQKNQIVLDSATTLPLSIDPNAYTKATYEIVENSSERKRAFLVEEKSNKDGFIITLKVSNYDDRFYEHDQDLNDDIIDEDGNVL